MLRFLSLFRQMLVSILLSRLMLAFWAVLVVVCSALLFYYCFLGRRS